MARLFQIIFALLIIFFGLAFHVKNDSPVSLDFYVRTLDVPLSWVAVAAFALGVMLGLLVMLNTLLRLKIEIKRLRKKHEIATREIVNLRAIPINDGP